MKTSIWLSLMTALLPSLLTVHGLETQCRLKSHIPFTRNECAISGNSDYEAKWADAIECVPREAIHPTGEELCLYTSPSFNENRGLSVISSARTIHSTIKLLDISRESASLHRHHLAANSNHGNDGETLDLSYVVREIPGKGKGILATRNISRFDTLMVGFPAFVVEDSLFPPRGTGAQVAENVQRLFQRGLSRLTDKGRVLTMSRSMGDENVHEIEDIMRTNSFGLILGSKAHKGLYPEVAVSPG